jgi:hypothetical protein
MNVYTSMQISTQLRMSRLAFAPEAIYLCLPSSPDDSGLTTPNAAHASTVLRLQNEHLPSIGSGAVEYEGHSTSLASLISESSSALWLIPGCLEG